MTALDNIQAAKDSVESLQHQLAEVQRVLEGAEEVAAVGEAARRRAPQILAGVAAVVAAVVVVRVVVARRRQARELSSG